MSYWHVWARIMKHTTCATLCYNATRVERSCIVSIFSPPVMILYQSRKFHQIAQWCRHATGMLQVPLDCKLHVVCMLIMCQECASNARGCWLEWDIVCTRVNSVAATLGGSQLFTPTCCCDANECVGKLSSRAVQRTLVLLYGSSYQRSCSSLIVHHQLRVTVDMYPYFLAWTTLYHARFLMQTHWPHRVVSFSTKNFIPNRCTSGLLLHQSWKIIESFWPFSWWCRHISAHFLVQTYSTLSDEAAHIIEFIPTCPNVGNTNKGCIL